MRAGSPSESDHFGKLHIDSHAVRIGPVDTWDYDLTGETATGPTVVVAANGALVATLTPLWDDVGGVRVSIDWQAALDDLSTIEARALAAALVELADVEKPPVIPVR
jgi:hypothetical protein